MDRKWKIGLIGAVILGLSLAGCVEEDASLVMFGSIIGSGDVDTGDEDTESRAVCEFPLDFDEPNVWTTGRINLTELGNTGQPLVEGFEAGSVVDRYSFQAVFENRLFDSRNVGAVSGGSGGGFQDLELDKNDIIITSATVEFPADANTFNIGDASASFEGLQRERLSSMLVQSGGGVGSLDVPLIHGASERAMFESFIDGMGIGADQVITFVVNIQLHGHTLGGTEVESNIFSFPIDMCQNCPTPTNGRCVDD